MTLITSSRFDFLTLSTPYNFVLGQITIKKTKITNVQKLPKIISIRLHIVSFLTKLIRIWSKIDKL